MPSVLRGLTVRGVGGLWGPAEEKQSKAVRGGRVTGFGMGPPTLTSQTAHSFVTASAVS